MAIRAAAKSDEVDALLAAAETLTMNQWIIVHKRFGRLRPVEWRKLNDVLFVEGDAWDPYAGLSERAQERLSQELRSQVGRVSEIAARLPTKVSGDAGFGAKMEIALGRLVYLVKTREYIRSAKGQQAVAVVDGLFEGLFGGAANQDDADDQDRSQAVAPMKRTPDARTLAHSDRVDPLLAKAEALTVKEWRIVRERFDQLRPHEWRKLNDALFEDGDASDPYRGLSAAVEQRLSDELDSQIDHVFRIVERLPPRLAGDPEFRVKMEVALGRLVYVARKREHIQSPKGKHAAAIVDGLFDGLLTGVTNQDDPNDQDRTTGLYSLGGALALRRKPRSHPVSAAYGAAVAIWDRIESHLQSRRDERKLTHGEHLFRELFFRLDGEVQNGGLEAYLENSAGDSAEMARAYLAEISAWSTLEALDLIADQFPDGVIPAARGRRVRLLEKVELASLDFSNPVGAATDLYLKAQLTLYERLLDYVEDHPEDFERPDAAEIRQLAEG